MTWRNKKATLLSRAAESGSKTIFEAVMAALEDRLTPAEVKVKGFMGLVFPYV